MKHKQFGPSPKYLPKLRLIISLIVGGIYLSMIAIAWPISLDDPRGATIYAIVLTVTAAVSWVVGMVLSGPYARSLQYEILDDEVIVRVGIITKSVKHVPYRTVTNITIKRGLLDRYLFDLGTLNIQTAGMSGTTGAEESLEGLPNVQEIYDLVVTELRRFRSGMTPTAADVDTVVRTKETAVSAATLDNILVELQAVRHLMESKQA
ncbi:MAG: PH domain-containing protein [Chloroflexota bacterium]|nr:PH domain-containing protein [Anaerolineales bacterium]MCB8968452.1 PH domain-containing protein [Ardenticatenaceae bacterium]